MGASNARNITKKHENVFVHDWKITTSNRICQPGQADFHPLEASSHLWCYRFQSEAKPTNHENPNGQIFFVKKIDFWAASALRVQTCDRE